MPWSSFLECWVLSQVFSLSSLIFIKRLFSSSSLSAIRVVSSAYLRLLIFLLEILIPAYASYNLAFCMIYTSHKLNKQDDNIQPSHTLSLILNQSVVLCLVLNFASWPRCRFLKRQVSWKKFPQFFAIHTVKGFSIVNEAETVVFLWNPLDFCVIQMTLAIWSLAPLHFLNLPCTSGSSWFMNCWSLAWRILSITS